MSHIDMIDKIIEIVPSKYAIATRGLTMTEDIFSCHFPKFPILPGVLMLQAVNELSERLIAKSENVDNKKNTICLKEMGKVKFYKYCRPGDTLKIYVKIVKKEKKKIFLSGKIERDNNKVFQVKKIIYEIY